VHEFSPTLVTFVQSAIHRPAQQIRVEHDTAKGFPREIDYDGAAQIADDEISYRVSDVHPIAPQTPLQLQRRVEEPA
jgi:hypothetical protein